MTLQKFLDHRRAQGKSTDEVKEEAVEAPVAELAQETPVDEVKEEDESEETENE